MDELPRAEELARLAELRKQEMISEHIKELEELIYIGATQYGLREVVTNSLLYEELIDHLEKKGYKVSFNKNRQAVITF